MINSIIELFWDLHMFVIFTFRLNNETVIIILLFSYVHCGHHATDVLPRWWRVKINKIGRESICIFMRSGWPRRLGYRSTSTGWCMGGWGRGASISWGNRVCDASCSLWSHSPPPPPPPPFLASLRRVCYAVRWVSVLVVQKRAIQFFTCLWPLFSPPSIFSPAPSKPYPSPSDVAPSGTHKRRIL